MATATEQLGRGGTGGGQSTRERIYHVEGATGVQDAVDTVQVQIQSDLGGLTLDGLALSGIDPQETGADGEFVVAVTWGRARGVTRQKPGDPSRIGFEFGQQTVRAKHSFQTRRYGDRPPVNRGNAVNQRKDADGKPVTEGVDVPSPAFSFSKSRVVAASSVTNAFLSNTASVFLHTNAQVFAGFPSREVLFTGLTGTQRSDDEYELTYRFARQPNFFGQISGVSSVVKYGWDYLEPIERVEEGIDSGGTGVSMISKIVGFYVHEMFPIGSFSVLGLE